MTEELNARIAHLERDVEELRRLLAGVAAALLAGLDDER